MSKKKLKKDMEIALGLHQQFNSLGVTENAVFPKDKNDGNYQPKTLIDQTLEIIDPTPNIYTLFSQFDARFFSNKLVSVEVKWSQRMTSCAGVCSFHSRSRDCVISLSAPLLKLRPRKDLVETLLHEMIHGYLFLTNNNRDRDGHGPEFRKIMDRINKEAGTHITIYHTFHDEVKLYQQHWWRCDGPCQKRPPYFGMVRRAMNRAPGPSDFWWADHKERCNGRFIKVREPEKKIRSRSKLGNGVNENKNPKEKTSNDKSEKKLDDWLTKIGGKSDNKSGISKDLKSSNDRQTKIDKSSGFVKLGTATNNVHGWGTGGPGTSSSMSPSVSSNKKLINNKTRKTMNFVSTLGGVVTGRSNLLDKYSSPVSGSKHRVSSVQNIDESPATKKPKIVDSSNNDKPKALSDDTNFTDFYHCPICNLPIIAHRLNDHLDTCLVNGNKEVEGEKESSIIEIFDSPEKRRSDQDVERSSQIASSRIKEQTNLVDSFIESSKKATSDLVSCPICQKILTVETVYDHLDDCVPNKPNSAKTPMNIRKKRDVDTKPQVSIKDSIDLTNDETNSSNESYVCLVCNATISGNIALTDHLEECVQAIFNDDTFDVGNDSISEVTSPKSNLTDDKYPCPICMNLIRENLMNEHLDNCLLSKK